MAIARAGTVISAISGNLGPCEFAHVHGLQIVKSRKVTTKKTSKSLAKQQAVVAQALQVWQALSPGSKQRWAYWAAANPLPNRLGQNRPLAPIQAFYRWIPSALSTWGYFAIYLDPPPGNHTTPAPLVCLTKITSPGTLTTQTIGDWPDDGTAFEQLFIACNVGPYRTKSKTWKLLPWKLKTDDTTDWSAELAAADISFQTGEYVLTKLRWCWNRHWLSIATPALSAMAAAP